MPERRFVLSMDGGGMRGIVPALVLADIERRTGRRVADLFDLVGGTSTGGLLALGLVKPGGDGPQYRALDLVNLYAEEGDVIFHQSKLWRVRSLGGLAEERYDERPLERLLRDTYFVSRLKQLGRDLIERSDETLDALCRQLTEPRVSASAGP
jgi:uncharacterized protein